MTDLPPASLVDALRRAGVAAGVRESSHYAGGEYVRVDAPSGVYCSMERVSPAEYLVRGDADALAPLESFARALSAALTGLGMRHRLELYTEDHVLAAYFHHQWPQTAG